jgi:DNA-binding MarR family transcriptional regulator
MRSDDLDTSAEILLSQDLTDGLLEAEFARQIDLSRCVPAVLTATANRVAQGASAAYRKDFGIGFIEWRIVSFLAADGCASGADLAEGLGLNKAAISRNLKTLAGRGLIVTRVAHGRRSESDLTAAGKAMHVKVLAVALHREETILRGLNAADKEKLISMLRLISRNLAELDG